MVKKLAIVCTHPIQYLAPVFRELACRAELKIKVFYGWEGTTKCNDPGFGQKVIWDIPLLEGYEYEFVRNIANEPGTHHFNGIDLPGLNKVISEWDANAILVFGWSFKAHLAAMKYFKHKIPVLFRGDSTLLDETPGLRKVLRRWYLNWVYKNVDVALSVGTNNKKYFEAHGLRPKQIVHAPHAVDNDRFAANSEEKQRAAAKQRESLGIEADQIVLMFVGKLEAKKSPEMLLDAFNLVNNPNACLIFVGSGELEGQLKDAAKGRKVHFLGFQNQTAMEIVYRMANVVVLPSRGPGETWGLALNEAMACGRAVIASDRVGASIDLIQAGRNGWLFSSLDLVTLVTTLRTALELGVSGLEKFGSASARLIAPWSIERQVDVIVKVLEETEQ